MTTAPAADAGRSDGFPALDLSPLPARGPVLPDYFFDITPAMQRAGLARAAGVLGLPAPAPDRTFTLHAQLPDPSPAAVAQIDMCEIIVMQAGARIARLPLSLGCRMLGDEKLSEVDVETLRALLRHRAEDAAGQSSPSS